MQATVPRGGSALMRVHQLAEQENLLCFAPQTFEMHHGFGRSLREQATAPRGGPLFRTFQCLLLLRHHRRSLKI